MTKRTLALLLALTLLLSLFSGCGSKQEPVSVDLSGREQTSAAAEADTSEQTVSDEDERFDSFESDFLLLAFEDDAYNWNAFAEDPASFGYVRPDDVEVSWYEYTPYGDEDEEYYEKLLDAKDTFDSFDEESLSAVNQAAWNALSFFFSHTLSEYSPDNEYALLIQTFVSQYGGYVANFASCVEDYKYRTEQDFLDIISYVRSTAEVFPTYQDYALARIEAGLPLSDYTLDKMISYLDGITDAGDSYYLFTVYALAADDAVTEGTLTAEQRDSYVSDFNSAMQECFLPAVASLSEALAGDRGHLSNPDRSYVAYAGDLGLAYYQWELEEQLGYSSIDLTEYENYLIDTANDVYNRISQISSRLSRPGNTDAAAKFEEILSDTDSFLGMSEYSEMMDWLLEQSAAVVEPLETTPEISFKDTDESVQEYVVYTAYYNVSPLDVTADTEYITINPYSFEGDPSYLLETLAHEGYPGHLYQHVHAKELGADALTTIFDNTGAGEGWAQYAAYAVLMSAAEKETDTATSLALEYTALVYYYNYIYSAYLDYLVNLCGMSASEIAEHMGCSEEDAIGYIHYCDENPAGIAPYGIGFAKLVELHEKAAAAVTDYSETEFNAWLLQDGMPYLSRMEELTDEYISMRTGAAANAA